MNGKIAYQDSPEGRLAAVAVVLMEQFEDRHAKTGVGPSKPDVADIREAIRPYIQRELIRARIDEAERGISVKGNRRTELVRELYEWERLIPEEYRL